MTKQERERISEAIHALMTDDGWERGMEILCKLGHVRMVGAEAAKAVKSVDIRTLRECRPFSYEDRRSGKVRSRS